MSLFWSLAWVSSGTRRISCTLSMFMFILVKTGQCTLKNLLVNLCQIRPHRLIFICIPRQIDDSERKHTIAHKHKQKIIQQMMKTCLIVLYIVMVEIVLLEIFFSERSCLYNIYWQMFIYLFTPAGLMNPRRSMINKSQTKTNNEVILVATHAAHACIVCVLLLHCCPQLFKTHQWVILVHCLTSFFILLNMGTVVYFKPKAQTPAIW